MKKIFILPFLIPTVAFAIKIDANTKIAWNAIVVVAALHDVGLNGDSLNYHPDVVLTYNRILDDLLNRKTFSAADAVSVCMQQCNKSVFLKEGRGESGRKCPDICKNFGTSLITENNKGIKSIKLDGIYGDSVYHPMGRIYSSDKKFYSFSADTKSSTCNDAVFESSTDKKIAVCTDGFGEGGLSETHFKVIDQKYNGFDFVLGCKFCITCDNGDEGSCWLNYVDTPKLIKELQQEYEKCANIYKAVDLSTIRTLSENPLIYEYDLKKISDNAEKIFALKNKFYGAKSDNFNDWDLKGPLVEYCKDISPASINATIEKAKSAIKCAKDNFKSTNTFKDTETETLEEAQKTIVRYLDRKCSNVKWHNMKCSGDCNGPGKQDYVSCTIGGLQATFEFDDICEGNWKQKAKSLFGK